MKGKTTNYVRGRAFEYKVQNDLREMDYMTIRSAGSHSPVDIVAVKPGRILFVQCKRDGRISKEEEAAIIKMATSIGPSASAVVATPGNPGIRYRYL